MCSWILVKQVMSGDCGNVIVLGEGGEGEAPLASGTSGGVSAFMTCLYVAFMCSWILVKQVMSGDFGNLIVLCGGGGVKRCFLSSVLISSK